MVSRSCERVLDAALSLLVASEPNHEEIGRALEASALPALRELIEGADFEIASALEAVRVARHANDNDEDPATPEEWASRDWDALNARLDQARRGFDLALSTSLHIINSFRRFRGKDEFAPRDTDQLLELMRMVLELPTANDLHPIGDYDLLRFEENVRRSHVEGIAHASFEISAGPFYGAREEYGYGSRYAL